MFHKSSTIEQFQIGMHLAHSQVKKQGKVSFWIHVFLKLFFQHHIRENVLIPSPPICILFFFQWNFILTQLLN